VTLDLHTLMADRSLSDASRVLGAYIALNDQGQGIELRFETISSILHGFPGKDKIRASIRPLEQLGYVTRKAGGAGHGDVFSWSGEPIGYGPNHTLYIEGEEIGSGPGHTVRSQTQGIGSGQNRRLRSQTQATSPLPLPPVTTTPPSPDARVREVSIEAERAISESESLVGCRDSLRDYLDARVEIDHHHGWARKLEVALSGGDEWMWKDRRGRTLHEGRVKVVASALNELLSCDEIGERFPDKPGGFGNLRAKVRYLVASALGAAEDATKGATATPAAANGIGTKSRPPKPFPKPEVSHAS